MKDRFFNWLYRNEILAWIGIAIGSGQIFASGNYGWHTAPGIILAVVGGLLVGGIGTLVFIGRVRRHPLEGLECDSTFEFTGKRGQRVDHIETMFIRAKTNLPSFKYCVSRADGQIGDQDIRYRNLGPGGRANPTEGDLFRLQPEHLFVSKDRTIGDFLVIHPPTPLKKKDVIQVVKNETATDSFPEESEYIEKYVIFPIKRLRFDVRFPQEYVLENCFSLKLDRGEPVERGLRVLTPTVWENRQRLQSTIENIVPGESYRVAWNWR